MKYACLYIVLVKATLSIEKGKRRSSLPPLCHQQDSPDQGVSIRFDFPALPCSILGIMHEIVAFSEDPQGRWTEHILDNGSTVHVHHADGAVWLYPQVKYFISLEDALSYVA